MYHLRSLALVLLSAIFCTSQQTSQSQPQLTIRQTVRRVVVDVVVRDSNNNPVHGLTAADFLVSENSQPQTVLSFDVNSFDTPSISLPADSPHPTPNNFVNLPTTPEHGPLYVILYDLANMEVDDQIDARRQALKFIDAKPAGTRFAIFVRSDGLYLVQGFTEDKKLLFAALDPKKPKSHVPRVFLLARNYGYRDPVAMLEVFNKLADFLNGLPGRKNLIWMAGTFPLAFFPRAGDPHDYRKDIQGEINRLTLSQIAVYPVSVRGVVTNPEGAPTGMAPHGGAGGESASPPPNLGNTPASSTPAAQAAARSDALNASLFSSLAADYEVQKELARSTGGRAFISTNDVAAALTEATLVDGNYYSLTYSPTDAKDDGTLRNIKVKLAHPHPGYELSYRRSYYALALRSPAQPESHSALETSAGHEPYDSLQSNMKHGGPMVHDLLFAAHIHTEGRPARATTEQMEQLSQEPAYFRTRRKNKPPKPLDPIDLQTYAIDYRVSDPTSASKAAQAGDNLAFEFAACAFDAEGRVLNGIVNDALRDTSAAQGGNKSQLFRVRQELDVPLNADWIRIGVRDKVTGRMGTLEVQLPLAPQQSSGSSPSAH